MKKYLIILIFLLFSCQQTTQEKPSYRQDFTPQEVKVMHAARKIIDGAYYGTFITLNNKEQPKARIMEPFKPDEHFVIYLATTPKSRKVSEIKNNPTATLHYFDKTRVGYVSLMGKAFIENDTAVKHKLWKAGWERFYKNQNNDYLIIKFIPKYLELISIPEGFTGDKETWEPSRVSLVK